MPHTILVVDDTPKNVKLLADILAVKGYGVRTADTGERALQSIRAVIIRRPSPTFPNRCKTIARILPRLRCWCH